MNWIIKGAAMLAAAALAFGAQGSDPDFKGKFSLPYEVHWGQVVLPAGDYVVERNEMSRPQVMYIRTHGSMYMVLAGVTADFSGSGSRLELKNIAGMRFVTKLEVAPAGSTYTFRIPKAYRNAPMEANAPVETVGVVASR